MSSPQVGKKPRKVSPPTIAGSGAAAALAPSFRAIPTLRSHLLRLPEDLLLFMTGYLIPPSPFLQRPNQPAFHYPIAVAMRDLRSVSLVNTQLKELVAKLRLLTPQEQFRELASRTEFEHHEMSQQARSACIDRWGKDPALPNPRPQLFMRPVRDVLIAGEVSSVETLGAFCLQLERSREQVRSVHLQLDSINGLDALAPTFGACNRLTQLKLSSRQKLAPQMLSWAASLPLQDLTLEGPGMECTTLGALERGVLAASLKSLTLAVKGLRAQDLGTLANASLPQLSLLAISDCFTDLASCQTLSDVLPTLPSLRSLSLGAGKACIDSQGTLVLLKAILAHPGIARLGLHQIDPAMSKTLLASMHQEKQLEELTWGGPLPADAAKEVWEWLSRPGLRSLTLIGSKLDAASWRGLTQALAANSFLRELSIVEESLPEKASADLPQAIKDSNLARLSLDRCAIDSVTAERLGRCISAHPSLLVVQVLLYKGARILNRQADLDTILHYISAPLKEHGKLVQFDVSSEVCAGRLQLELRLLQNRLQGGKAVSCAANADGSTLDLNPPSAALPNPSHVGLVQALPRMPIPASKAPVSAVATPVSSGAHASTAQARRRRATKAQALAKRHRYAAALGEGHASFALGEAFRLGRGEAKDFQRAFRCYRDAALAGHSAAQYQLGVAYLTGQGVAPNALQSVKWLQRSAELRHPPALLLLGVYHEKGIGLAPDKQRAFFLYAQAADLGHARAQFKLSVCYARGTGVKQNLNKALSWFERAAAQNPERVDGYGKAVAALTRAATHLAETGSALQEHGSRTQASVKFRKALVIREKVLGVDHPETSMLQQKLILLQGAKRS